MFVQQCVFYLLLNLRIFTGYSKTVIDKEPCLLSPLLLNAYKNREKRPSHNPFKSDVFSLGMTIIECFG